MNKGCDMKMRLFPWGILSAVLVLHSPLASTAELSPEVQLASRGIVSLEGGRLDGKGEETNLDFSDTSILLGFRQKLYGTLRARMAIGLQFTDLDSELGPVFFHQVVLKIEDQKNIIRVGRARLGSAMIEFPTSRDDDALFFSDVLNPLYSLDESEPSQFGEILEYRHVFAQRYWVRVFGAHLKESAVSGQGEVGPRFNSGGLFLEYRVPESQRWNRPVLAQLGLGYNASFKRTDSGDDLDGLISNFLASAIVNLNPDPVHFVDIRSQFSFNMGLTDIPASGGLQLALEKRLTTMTSLRYLYRKLERPMLQVALTYGYTRLLDTQVALDSHLVIANIFYRLGENFDLGVQGKYLRSATGLHDVLGGDELQLQAVLIYNIDESWNEQFDDRDSLLNLEHGYIP